MNYTITIQKNDGAQQPAITVPFDTDEEPLALAQKVIAVLLQKKRTRGPNKAKTPA